MRVRSLLIDAYRSIVSFFISHPKQYGESTAMANFKVGAEIAILCETKPGPFSDEKLISFETLNGPVSGFVRESELKQVGEEWFVKGVILKIEAETLEVMVDGSFFTTNGLASISTETAKAA